MWIAGLVVLGAVVVLAIGAAIQAALGSEGQVIDPTVPPPAVCDDFCRDLKLARAARCSEEAHARAVDQDMRNLMSLLDRAMVTWLALTAAAIAAAAIPFIGGFIVASLSAAAAAAFTAVVLLEGMVAVAVKQSSDARNSVVAAMNRETAAMAMMLKACSLLQQTTCLSGLMPCQ
jgi:hypothetical protein